MALDGIVSARPSKSYGSPCTQTSKNPDDGLVSRNVLLFLIALRILNALTINTFFQPDEYFQSLEPAWQLAFGKASGAWITWVSYHDVGIKHYRLNESDRNGSIISDLLFILCFLEFPIGSSLFLPVPLVSLRHPMQRFS